MSARTMEAQKVAAVDAGADDFVTKPFSAPELLARVRASLRRGVRGSEQSPQLQLGKITIDLTRREAHSPEGDVHLTPLEYRVLESLARQAGMIVVSVIDCASAPLSRQDAVWRYPAGREHFAASHRPPLRRAGRAGPFRARAATRSCVQ